MKVAILANPDSTHIRKWVTALCGVGIDIVLISMHEFDKTQYSCLANFKSYAMRFKVSLNYYDQKFSKLSYLTVVRKIKSILNDEKPDILHAHYASSYGLLGALTKFHPYIISVWGSDIFEFPYSSFIAKRILKFNLSKADYILATSNALANEVKKYSPKQCKVTPFGVDTDVFVKNKKRNYFEGQSIVIGAIKTFEKVYGIEYLIRAFAIVADNLPEANLNLLLVGKGSCETEYHLMVKELGLEQKVIFAGYVDHTEISDCYNNLDIFVVPSIRESFGVSALEASACGLPVIASDTGGLPEVVINNVTGIIVPVQDSQAIAQAIKKLVEDKALREKLGNNGRKMVVENYKWSDCLAGMMNVYAGILNTEK